MASQVSLRTPDFGVCSSAGDLHSAQNSYSSAATLHTPEFGTQEFLWNAQKDSEGHSRDGSMLIPSDRATLNLPIVSAAAALPHLQLPCHQPVLPTILSARRAESGLE